MNQRRNSMLEMVYCSIIVRDDWQTIPPYILVFLVTRMKITILDYGVGNLSSVQNIFTKIGARADISSDPKDILRSDKVVLPGVGHFDFAMSMLNKTNLLEPLNEFALVKKGWLLGICLGAQILGKSSDEGMHDGLGWIDMTCKKFPDFSDLKVPHMRWNKIKKNVTSELLSAVDEDSRFYFVHSYYMSCNNLENVAATTEHGIEFPSVVQSGNIFGVQFHPEKSLKDGFSIIKKFANL